MSDLKREYYADGYLSQEVAEELGPEIERLAEARGGDLLATDVLQEARRPDSPFHRHITWDTERAAIQWQLQECRNLLNGVHVRLVRGDGEVVSAGPVLVLVRVKSEPPRQVHEGGYEFNLRPYRLTSVVRTQPEVRDQVLEDAKNYLLSVKRRLETLQGVLQPHFPAAQQVLEALEEFERETVRT